MELNITRTVVSAASKKLLFNWTIEEQTPDLSFYKVLEKSIVDDNNWYTLELELSEEHFEWFLKQDKEQYRFHNEINPFGFFIIDVHEELFTVLALTFKKDI